MLLTLGLRRKLNTVQCWTYERMTDMSSLSKNKYIQVNETEIKIRV